MANKPRYKSGFGFIDLLFNLLVGFTFMFILAFILINPVAKKASVDPKAEYIVLVTWDDTSTYDIDTWVMDDQNNIISFRRKDHALIHLERDDMGISNDRFIDKDGKEKIRQINREAVSIRSRDPRVFYVSLHWFSNGGSQTSDPIDVTVEFISVNPFVSISTKTVTLTKTGQEIPVYRIEIFDDKSVDVEDSNIHIIYSDTNLRKEW
jgi:hypothetical protein